MTRLALVVLASAMMAANAFVPMKQYSQTALHMVDDVETESRPTTTTGRFVERGVSVDQDGKSNVWAIEPKMEVSTKSSEEQTSSALVAGGGLAAAVVAAGLILTNLPDPNQF